MEEIIKALENLSLFLAGCAHVQGEGPVQTTFNAVRGDILKISESLMGFVSSESQEKEPVLSEN